MSRRIRAFRYEKKPQNSVLFKEDPDEDKTAVVGTLYVKQWFADNSKILEVTIDNKDFGC